MTVIRPNSISGVTSITALQNSIEFYKSDGSLSGANIDGISINTSGIITATTFNGTNFDINSDSGHLRIGADQDLDLYHNGSNGYLKNSTGQQLYRSGTHTFENAAGSTEYLRITSGGQVRIGNPNNLAAWGQNNRLQVAGTDWSTSGVTIANMVGSNIAPNLVFGKSRGSTPGTAIVNGDRLGYISFTGDDGTDMYTVGAAIVAGTDAAPSSNSISGMLQFYTGGNQSSNERLRIDSSGYVTQPNQPYFSGIGYAGAGSSPQTGLTAFRASSIYINQGNHFNNTTGYFTCPVDGKYLMIANFSRRSSQYSWQGGYLVKNATSLCDSWFPPAINNTSNYGLPAAFRGDQFTYAPCSMNSLVSCSANDTLSFCWHNSYSQPMDHSANNWTIMLVG